MTPLRDTSRLLSAVRWLGRQQARWRQFWTQLSREYRTAGHYMSVDESRAVLKRWAAAHNARLNKGGDR